MFYKHTLHMHQITKKGSPALCSTLRWLVLPVLVVLVLFMSLALLSGLYRRYSSSQLVREQMRIVTFEERFEEICAAPKLPMPPYLGVSSFFDFLQNPETDFCYSWLEFGGEILPVKNADDAIECKDEVRKAKYVCFNDNYKFNHDPCLVYSFRKDEDDQFERDMHLFSCEAHAFDTDKVTLAEHIKRSQFWFEHAYDISEFPHDVPASEDPKGILRRRRPLDMILKQLQHERREIKYIKSDLLDRDWMLLKQILVHQDKADVRQIGLQLRLPGGVHLMSKSERHDNFQKLFKVFQGLACSGYRYIMARPIKYNKGGILVPEMNKTFYRSYEVNFAKDLNI